MIRIGRRIILWIAWSICRRAETATMAGRWEAPRQLRIVLCGMSNLLANIVTGALAQFPDMIVAGRVDNARDLNREIRRARADVVIMPAAEPDRGHDFEPLLRTFPRLKIVALRIGGDRGWVHELRLFSLPLAELSAETLNAALHPPPPSQ